MRETTVDERTLLASHERVVGVRCEVQNASQTWKQLTSLSGLGFADLDFFIGATWQTDIDAPTWTGTLSLASERILDALTGEKVSIASYMETSPANVDDDDNPAPLIEGMRRIRWFTTVESLDGAISTEHKVFDGYVVGIEQKDDIEVSVSDLGHRLVIAQIKDERVYEPGLLSTRLQDILNDNLGVEAPTLVVDASMSVDPVMLSSKFKVERGRVMQTIRDLAFRTVGANVRYMWVGEDMQLVLFMPPRTKAVADFTYDKNAMYPTPSWKENTDDVRNTGRHYFQKKGTRALSFTEYDVPESIAKYKERYFEFREGVGSELQDPVSSKRFLKIAIDDLAQPKAEKQYTSLYNWASDVYDLYTLVANDVQYSSNQSLATTRVSHTINVAEQTTSFDTRGNIAGFSRRWIAVEGKGSDAPSDDLTTVSLGMGGEGSMYGGELFNGKVDGCLWPYLFIGKNIKRIHIWHRENKPGNPVTLWPPTSSDMYKAVTLERPEGRIPRDGNFTFPDSPVFGPRAGQTVWRMLVPLPTTPGARGGVIIQAETFDGTFLAQERLDWVAEDGAGTTEPNAGSIVVTRIDATTVRVTGSVAGGEVGTVLVFRDGINIDQIDVTSGSFSWDDPELHSERSYKYTFCRFSNNRSGGRNTVFVDAWSTTFAFADDTPARVVLPDGSPRVKIAWSGTPVGTTHVRVLKSKDSGHYDLWNEAATVPVADLPYYDAVVYAGQYYQLEALDATGAVLDTSDPEYWSYLDR